MARINNLTNFLTDVASAIKTKRGIVTNIPAANFDVEIMNIVSFSGQEKTVNPLTTNQSVTPDTGYDALTIVNITAVTSNIDSNITAENIKKNTTILNITGTYEGAISEEDFQTAMALTENILS